MTKKRDAFIAAVVAEYGKSKDTISRAEIIDLCEKTGLGYPHWVTNDNERKVGRGLYDISDCTGVAKERVVSDVKSPIVNVVKTVENNVIAMAPPMARHAEKEVHATYIPSRARGYVPFGHFPDVRTIVASKKFYPVYITGLSGNGKTLMVEQVCAIEKREFIRVNITQETDEDDLIGGFRLVDGQTVWQNGPVIHAMERGAVLLLDEVDLGSSKLMCLQPILEGRGIFLKKISKEVKPAPGFNIIATANTKGKGSDDGRFIGTQVMNEAFLERFSITLEQEYPNAKVEAKILKNVLSANGIEQHDFAAALVSWAEVIRKSFAEGAVPEIISTRRLVHICEAYSIFGQDRMKAIVLCLNRFDEDTKTSFIDLYKKLDETATTAEAAVDAAKAAVESQKEVTF
jgi:MoxR-like ATPase